jgi:hypothetical protein
LKAQSEALYRKTTVDEISDMIRGHLLDMLSGKSGMDVSADELADLAWEREWYDGSVFYSSHKADQFVMRHLDWVDRAVEHITDNFWDMDHLVKMKAGGNDRFLVAAFMAATECYVYDQLGIDRDEGDLTKTRIKEIKKRINAIEYDGGW